MPNLHTLKHKNSLLFVYFNQKMIGNRRKSAIFAVVILVQISREIEQISRETERNQNKTE